LAVFGDVGPLVDDAAIDRLLDEITAVVGDEGHILVPTFTLGAEFDVETSPAATGRLADRFRRRPGVVRSHHPTHSIAIWGPQARLIAGDHDVYLPFRPETPLGQLVARDGKVLLLGNDQRANALIPVARLSVERERPVIWINVDTVLEFGGRRRRRYVAPPCDRAYSSLGPEFEARGLAHPFETGWGRMTWMLAREVTDYVAATERNNPERFLCSDSHCRWCNAMKDLLERV
jgi:aminoglycoside 3-N-acetyltransferase